MPVNKVLLPINSGVDFAPGGGSIGWVPMSDGSSLVSVSQNVITDGAAKTLKDHAIPSPIAYIKHFKHKLERGDEQALNEWRGMLAVIALQKIKGYNITIKDIPLYPNPETGNPTAFGKVICEELIANSNVTGYSLVKDAAGNMVPNYNTLSVFCKDGVPFAMFMPSIFICPFKSYPIDLFSGLQWYDDINRYADDPNVDPKGTWHGVRANITSGSTLSVTAQKLYLWLQGIENAYPTTLISNYKNYILEGLAPPLPANSINPIACNYGQTGASVYQQLKNICPLPEGAPYQAFSEKVLFIIPKNNFFDGTTPDGKDYRIDKGFFTPKKAAFFGTDSVYVVPPIHSDVVDSLKNGHAQLSEWSFIKDGNKYKCEFHLHFQTGEVLSYVRKFSTSEIAWTECLPYISMWPYVNFAGDTWKEHYVAICANNEGLGSRLTSYQSLVDDENAKHVLGKKSSDLMGVPELNISLVALSNDAVVDEYISDSAYKNQQIKFLSSTSQPFALEFSYVDAGVTYKLGSWVLDRSKALNVTAVPARTYYVAMDFGTTSTNVYLRDNAPLARARSISSAGKYLNDVFNPYISGTDVLTEAENISDFIQNYYMFSNSNKELGKIFTYGQNFSSTKNGVPLGNIVSNASGRMVVVDEEFILNGTIGGNSGIYNGLKMRNGTGVRNDPNRDKAKDNFICNVLTYAVLEAKAEGASNIELRVSFPSANFGSAVIGSISSTIDSLKAKSGLNINVNGATEARAAGEYFANALPPIHTPVPAHGYAIIDIGGGTTDFSFWKGATTPEMKSENSFGYAGNYLVERTIIQGIKSQQDFASMWSYPIGNSTCVEARAIARYNSIQIQTPVGMNPTIDYFQKSATIDFLLEKCEVNAGVIGGPQYNDFLSAVRMKYYSLFYLVATYIKSQIDKGIIELSPINFRICLAGCGSKGMSFARMGSMGADFDNNLREIFEGVIGLQPGVLQIVNPVTNNKEEVVIGLTLVQTGAPIRISGASAPAAPVAPKWQRPGSPVAPVTNEVAGMPAEEEQQINVSFEELNAAYADLLAMLSWYELPHDANGPIHDGVSLVDRINRDVMPDAEAYYNSIFAIVDAQARESNPNPATFAENFALLMLENMIDEFI